MNPLYININIDPNIGTFGPFTITWHGLFTAIAIAAAVVIIAYLAKQRGVREDDVYNIALWAVPSGIVGARLLYVFEHASTFSHDLGSVFSVNEGGISVYGGLIGGALAGFIYAWRKHLPVRRIADCAGIGLPIASAIGRIGDFINGEHWAKATSLPWGFCYTNPNTLNGDPNTNTTAICGSITRHPLNPPAVHPVAGLYEPIALLLIAGVCWYLWRRFAVAGYVFWIYVILYAAMRAGFSPLRLNESKVGAISVPQIVSIATVALAVAALYLVRRMALRNPEAASAMQRAPASQPVTGGITRPRPRST